MKTKEDVAIEAILVEVSDALKDMSRAAHRSPIVSISLAIDGRSLDMGGSEFSRALDTASSVVRFAE